MAKKRKQRRNPIHHLGDYQEWELRIGQGGRGSNFESDLQRRAAWFYHRESFLQKYMDEYPGRRPWAFWYYEQPAGREYSCQTQWKYLLQNNLLLEGEYALVLAGWLQMLDLRRGVVEMTYEHHQEGIPAMHGNPEWPEMKAEYEHQAALLGEPALQAWAKVLEKLTQEVKKNE